MAAGGETSGRDREAAYALAEKNANVVGFILDDFFHEPSTGNAEMPTILPAGAAKAPFRASLTPAELHALGQRKVRGVHLPIMAVIYTAQVHPRAAAHLAEVEEVCLWTWRPEDLKNLAGNFEALKRLTPDKPVYLGCYMYDFHASKPIALDLMRQQVEQGYRWLRSGRIAGMIFLATPNVDVGLEAVDWTRQWIAAHKDREIGLPR